MSLPLPLKQLAQENVLGYCVSGPNYLLFAEDFGKEAQWTNCTVNCLLRDD